MNKSTKNLFLFSSVFIALYGCNSDNKTSTPNEPLPVIPVTPITASETLPLDFTLPLSALNIDASALAGATLNTERGDFAILSTAGELIYMSPEGTITGETQIENENSISYTGIEYIEGSRYVVSSSESQVFFLNDETLTLDELAQVDFTIGAVAYDDVAGSAIVVDDGSPSKIVSISATGELSESLIESDIKEDSVTGLTLSDDMLFIASVTDVSGESLIISASITGEIETVWSIDSNTTSGLVVLDPETPEILTTNADDDKSITLFETPRPPSVPSHEVLVLHSSAELEFNQPSGIDFSPETSALYYVTDFGEVRKGTAEGENEILFEIETMQGSFEAITHIASNNTLALMMSDDSGEESYIVVFDMAGNQLSTYTIPLASNEHQFESIDYNATTDTYLAVTASEEQKVLYQISTDEVITTDLPESYDDFVISGIAIAQDGTTLYMTTEEWEDESEILRAGLLVQVDLLTNTELSRYSLAVEVDGEVEGIVAPSDIAIDEANNLIFITSDIDGSILYVFELL